MLTTGPQVDRARSLKLFGEQIPHISVNSEVIVMQLYAVCAYYSTCFVEELLISELTLSYYFLTAWYGALFISDHLNFTHPD